MGISEGGTGSSRRSYGDLGEISRENRRDLTIIPMKHYGKFAEIVREFRRDITGISLR